MRTLAALLVAFATGLAQSGDEAQSRSQAGGWRLARSESPYLRAHAQDPVEWHPFGPEALALAKRQDRPILLSSGYLACHWCHVMRRESFQDPAIAAVINRAFIAVKLDREERPDVDRVYIEACQHLTRGGCGWPLTVFMLPSLEPFFVGTYFPPEDRGPHRGFRSICEEIERMWREDRALVVERARTARAILVQSQRVAPSEELPGRELLRAARDAFLAVEDRDHGGFGQGAKFPVPLSFLLLERVSQRDQDQEAGQATERLLWALRRGGIRDHLAGGYHRYSVDRAWRVPHFEKMLYDQALVALLFLHVGVRRGDRELTAEARDVLERGLLPFAAPEGAWFSALDAETDHEEGRTYTWTWAELAQALPGEEVRLVAAWAGATPEGELAGGRSVLAEARSPAALALEFGLPEAEIQARLARAQARLLAARAGRPQPALDTKVLAGWNGLVLSALARGARGLEDPGFHRKAVDLGRFLTARLVDEEGLVRRVWAMGRVLHEGDLFDHAAVAAGLLDLAELDPDPKWLDRAAAVARRMAARFENAEGILVDARGEDLVVETADLHDGAMASGRGLALQVWARLGIVTEAPEWTALAERHLRSAGATLAMSPTTAPGSLLALDLLLGPSVRVGLRGDPEAVAERGLLGPLREHLAHAVFPVWERDSREEDPAAVVCVGTRCLDPAHDAASLRARIAEALAAPR
jgi:uncharacterized protein YyaL (SSP411 family)